MYMYYAFIVCDIHVRRTKSINTFWKCCNEVGEYYRTPPPTYCDDIMDGFPIMFPPASTFGCRNPALRHHSNTQTL